MRPNYLKVGDKVALVAPAGKVDKETVDNGLATLQSWGLTVEVGKHVLDRYRCFAGTDDDRASDFQQFIDDPEIRAIICLRGGYGCARLMNVIDFALMVVSPKWLVGFSDVTVLHAWLNGALRVESLHAAMPIGFHHEGISDPDEYERRKASTESLREALFGRLTGYEFAGDALNVFGRASGRLLGGNLTLLQSLAGTGMDFGHRGTILFLEDVGESAYRIDRMMMNLVQSGKLSRVAGLLIGDFSEVSDEEGYGATAREIIAEHVAEFGIPVAYGFPAGHRHPNLAMYFGRNVRFEVTAEGASIKF